MEPSMANKRRKEINFVPEDDGSELSFQCQWYNTRTKKNFTVEEIKEFQRRLIESEM